MEGLEGVTNKKPVLGAQRICGFVRYVLRNLKPYYPELLVLKTNTYQTFVIIHTYKHLPNITINSY